MQLAMASVNEQNRIDGLPDVEMGIGLHTGQVIVGNIGSSERLKYGVVGSHVNLTSRIQSFTVGGQILASESTRRDVGRMLKIGKQMEVRAKGFEQQIMLCEVLGIGGPYKLMLYQSAEALTGLSDPIPLTCSILEGDLQGEETFGGSFWKLSAKQAEARLEKAVPVLSNLKIRLINEDGQELDGALYGKVVSTGPGGKSEVLIHFTSMSREIETFLNSQRRKLVRDGESLPISVPRPETPSEQTALH
jgi:adenylate cyclase